MNQTLANTKKVIEDALEENGVEFNFVEESDSPTEQPIVAYRTDYGFGMFSDRNVEEVTFFIMVKEGAIGVNGYCEEEDSEYVEVKLPVFIDILSGNLDIKKLLDRIS